MSKEEKVNQEIIVIKDVKSILISMGVCAFAIIGILNGVKASGNEKMIYLLASKGLFIIGALRAKVEFSGIRIDSLNDIISFPGGAVKFNSISQFILNLNQRFRRYSYKISEIEFIKAEDKRNISKDGKISYSYLLTFTGNGGTVTLPFTNSAQRDQVYAIIVNLNNMGIPVQNR